MKNIAIVVLTTACRAAIRGGMLPEVAFSMEDLYIQEIEACVSVERGGQILRSAEFQYTLMVHELKKSEKRSGPADVPSCDASADPSESITVEDDRKDLKNSFQGSLNDKIRAAISGYAGQDTGTPMLPVENEHISAAKNYIFRNLHRTLTAAEVADALGLNRNYLSGLFRRVTGETIKAYIIRNKITLVKNLLTYSSYSYSEITAYLGFSSQSHLGTAFKKETGMTLSQYRKKYQMQEFMD